MLAVLAVAVTLTCDPSRIAPDSYDLTTRAQALIVTQKRMDWWDGFNVGTDYLTNLVIFGKDKFRVDLAGLWLGGHEPGNLHLYRIAREAVINANKHACAREIIVRMRSSANRLELSVTDDGIGLSPDSHLGAGMGLQIMDYRARSIGARLEIKTVRPHGTRVACYLPRR